MNIFHKFYSNVCAYNLTKTSGENLLEKAEEQERLLDESARQLEETITREASLRKALKEKEAERLDVEEKYSSLQEEAAGKTRKLKKVWTMLTAAKGNITDSL